MQLSLSEGKEKFIAEWGTLSMNWGVNRTMGQIHALLLISANPLCAEDVMCNLKISRGNVNMNLRALLDWGLAHKVLIKGERKEFFKAEKEVWKILQLIISNRKKKELDPMIDLLNKTASIQPQCPESDEFCKMVKELQHFSSKADMALNLLTNSKTNMLNSPFMKMMR